MTRILEENVQSGTGTRAAFGRPAAGKTGTNEEHADAWFAGYTPELASTVWVGYTRGEIPMLNVHGIAVAGGTFPAEIWRLFMEPALDRTDPESFPEPSSWPTWKPFTRGKYALTYDPSYSRATTTHHHVDGADDALASADRPRAAESMQSQLLSVEQALEQILSHARPLPSETVALEEANGRVLSEAPRSRVDLPPFPSSAMDGFAVRAADTPGELSVVFHVAAGTPPPGPLPPGAAAGIATGGTVPEGADAVVPIELVGDHGESISLPSVAPGQHVRPRGGDVGAGDIVVDVGTRLGAQHIGALAAAGVSELRCSIRPRVAVLATGTELRPPGAQLEAGQIYESNRAMIAAALASTGAIVELLPVVEDDAEAHREAVARGLDADVLVTSGGVSMGPHDLVRRVAADLGVREVFWGVAVKPGKPLAFGVRGETLVFGLPGNPVSSLVGALVFVRPALLARQGARAPVGGYLPGRLAGELRRNPQRDEFVRARRVTTTDGEVLEAIGGQESHMIVRAAAADALVLVPRGTGDLAAGSEVRFIPLA